MKVNNDMGNLLVYVDFENGYTLEDGSIYPAFNISVNDKVCRDGSGWYALTLYGKNKDHYLEPKKAVKLKSVDGSMEEVAKIMKIFQCDVVPYQVHLVEDGNGNRTKVYLASGPFLEKQHWMGDDEKVCYISMTESGQYIPVSLRTVSCVEMEKLDYRKIARLFTFVDPICAEKASGIGDRSSTEVTVNFEHITMSRETHLQNDRITMTINRGPLGVISIEWTDTRDDSVCKPEWLPSLYDLLV